MIKSPSPVILPTDSHRCFIPDCDESSARGSVYCLSHWLDMHEGSSLSNGPDIAPVEPPRDLHGKIQAQIARKEEAK
jgi:hypothetical protein